MGLFGNIFSVKGLKKAAATLKKVDHKVNSLVHGATHLPTYKKRNTNKTPTLDERCKKNPISLDCQLYNKKKKELNARKGKASQLAKELKNGIAKPGQPYSSSSSSGNDIIGGDTAAMDALGVGADAGGGIAGTGTGGTGGGGASSPLTTGDMTFEQLVGEICNGIDLVFAVKRNTVVITDYESLYAEAKYIRDYGGSNLSEDISLWQLEDGSYELDVTEYGFYNTVKVKYKNGTVTESYSDYVRVFGEVPIEYDEPEIDKTTAIMKAKAYLAAHIRDFDMTVKGTILHKAGIDIGDIVTLDNPLTLRDEIHKGEKKDPEFLFVVGNSISWDNDTGMILNDIELRYGPESPEKLDVPEAGGGYSKTGNGNIDSAIAEVAQMGAKYSYCHSCQTHDCVVSTGCGDCFGMSDFLCCELNSRGVTNKVVGYPTSVPEHRSVLYQDSTGQWVDFPYREYGFQTLFNNTAGSKTSTKVVPCSCGANSTTVSTSVSTQTTSNNTQI